FRYEILVEQIVRIEEEEPVIARKNTGGAQLLEQKIERISFANVQRIEALEYRSPTPARDLSRTIRAVIRADVNIHKAGRVFLCVDAVDQVADDRSLVARAEDGSIAPRRCRRQRLCAL